MIYRAFIIQNSQETTGSSLSTVRTKVPVKFVSPGFPEKKKLTYVSSAENGNPPEHSQTGYTK